MGHFLAYLITLSGGTKDNGPKPTRTGNLQLSIIFGENLRLIGRQMHPQTQVTSEETKINSLVAIDHHTHPTALFNNHFMRYPINSVLAYVLKTKQSRHKEKKKNLKDADMELEAESTNNEDKLLNKVTPLETHVVIDGGALVSQVFWSGTIINENRRYASSKYMICQIFKINNLSIDEYKQKTAKDH